MSGRRHRPGRREQAPSMTGSPVLAFLLFTSCRDRSSGVEDLCNADVAQSAWELACQASPISALQVRCYLRLPLSDRRSPLPTPLSDTRRPGGRLDANYRPAAARVELPSSMRLWMCAQDGRSTHGCYTQPLYRMTCGSKDAVQPGLTPTDSSGSDRRVAGRNPSQRCKRTVFVFAI